MDAIDCPVRDASADEIVEHPGIDRLRRTAPCDPHQRLVAAADETIDVHGVGVHAEVARGRALEQEPRRCAEFGGDGVALVAPRGEQTFGCERARDSFERRGARRRGVERAHEAIPSSRTSKTSANAASRAARASSTQPAISPSTRDRAIGLPWPGELRTQAITHCRQRRAIDHVRIVASDNHGLYVAVCRYGYRGTKRHNKVPPLLRGTVAPAPANV